MGLTTAGREWVIDRLQNVELPAAALMNFVGWGTSTTAEAVGDTDLIAVAVPTNVTRVTGAQTQPAQTTDRCIATITATSTLNIAEVGRFNVATVGAANQRMIQRHIFTAVPVVSGDSIQFTLDLTD